MGVDSIDRSTGLVQLYQIEQQLVALRQTEEAEPNDKIAGLREKVIQLRKELGLPIPQAVTAVTPDINAVIARRNRED